MAAHNGVATLTCGEINGLFGMSTNKRTVWNVIALPCGSDAAMPDHMEQSAATQPVGIDGLQPTRRGRPKLRDAEATREEILAAATEEFADKGLFGARVEEIAARTATSKHMIYYYFGSKDGLYSAVLEQAYARFRTAEIAQNYHELDPVAALSALVGNTFDAHIGNPQTVRILMSENLDRARHAREIDHDAQRELVIGTTRAILDRGVEVGLFRSDVDALQFHLMISAFSFFFVANRHTFGTVFKLDMADADVVATHRAEFIETMLCRCRA
jgi:AcrR family transcriptional regulator